MTFGRSESEGLGGQPRTRGMTPLPGAGEPANLKSSMWNNLAAPPSPHSRSATKGFSKRAMRPRLLSGKIVPNPL